MRAVIQRVTQASCTVGNQITGKIHLGFLVLLGIEDADIDEDLQWAGAKKYAACVFLVTRMG